MAALLRNLIGFSAALLGASTLLAVPARAEQALYGYLLVEKDGYRLSDDVTLDPSNPVVANLGSSNARPRATGWIKFRLDAGLYRVSQIVYQGYKLKSSCTQEGYRHRAWAPCSSYAGLERYFIELGRPSSGSNYQTLEFITDDFHSQLAKAVERAGYAYLPRKANSLEARGRDVLAAVARNAELDRLLADRLRSAVTLREKDIARYQDLVPYEAFPVPPRKEELPKLNSDLTAYGAAQDAARAAFEADVQQQFEAYFVPRLKAAEQDYPKLFAQRKAEQERQRKREEQEQAQQRAEQERQAKAEQARIGKFRSGIKVETETNCGPVLEIKGNLVKVFSPVQGYGNEHWLRRGQLLPAQYSCRFVNGNYVGPQ